MADVILRIETPTPAWAEEVRDLLQRTLNPPGESTTRGSVSIADIPPELPATAVHPPGFIVRGVVVCDDPEEDAVTMLTAALSQAGYTVSVSDETASSFGREITVKPA